MAIKKLYHNVPSCTGVSSIRINESFGSTVSQAQIECYDTSLELGDAISFNMGYVSDNGKIFTGYVMGLERSLPGAKTTITCEDILCRAVDFYMASDNPDEPWHRHNIKTEDLIEALLNEAGITNYTHNIPLSVTWGINAKGVEFNLTSCWIAMKTVIDALAWHIYADRNGQVHLTDDHPYVEGGDTPSYSWNSANGDMLAVTYRSNTDDLRNRVVVYGLNNLTASASAISPYLPIDYYKTAVIATIIIDSASVAQQTANLNLARFNRLTDSASIQVEGNWNIQPRQFCTAVDTYTGISGDWFISQVEHSMSDSGYTCALTLTR
jgi:hypothetical protein